MGNGQPKRQCKKKGIKPMPSAHEFIRGGEGKGMDNQYGNAKRKKCNRNLSPRIHSWEGERMNNVISKRKRKKKKTE